MASSPLSGVAHRVKSNVKHDPRRVFSAAFCGKVEKLRRLLEADDAPDWGCLLDWKNEQGVTPLHAACQEGHAECARLLLENGATVDVLADGIGDTPLHTACRFGREHCVALLLEWGASVSRRGVAHGETALHVASRIGSHQCVRLLLEAHAETEATDNEGATPLIVCSYHGHVQCVAKLLDVGASAAARYAGKGAYSWAMEGHHDEVAHLLVDQAREDALADAEEHKIPADKPGDKNTQAASTTSHGLKGALQGMVHQLEKHGFHGSEHVKQGIAELERAEELQEAQHTEYTESCRLEETSRYQEPKTSAQAKLLGTRLLKQGKVAAAAEAYELGLQLIEAERTRETSAAEPWTADQRHARAVLYSNVAACRLKQRKWKEAISACDEACALHPTYAKALYRRAQARRRLKQYEGAILDANAALAEMHKMLADVGQNSRNDTSVIIDEIMEFAAQVNAEAEKKAHNAHREEREAEGITLAALATQDKTKHTYYHFTLEGEKTQDWLWFVKQRLEQIMTEAWYTDKVQTNRGLVDRKIGVHKCNQDDVDGYVTIRTSDGRLALFFELQEITVEWRGVIGEGTANEQALGGACRLWNISHASTVDEWVHENRRHTHPEGPAQDIIGTVLAPKLVPQYKLAVQQVIGELCANKVDASLFAAAAVESKALPQHQVQVRKGTLDYSKWDHLSEDDD
ncbi:hypothetical protein AB1Y20_019235 [Prymnesium parvum]|uniref:Uncharacterized protein n=1 Tax=Prymnesium parvum TaxID=97485 RepID=A0AB34JTQ0_PRYPA